MKNNKFIIYFLASFLILMLVNVLPLDAQCSLCRSQVQSSLQAGNTTAEGLNNGIFILLASPYVLVAIVGFLWYRKTQKSKALEASKNSI